MNARIRLAAVVTLGSIVAWTTAVPAPSSEERQSETGAPAAPAKPDSVASGKSTARLRQRDPFRLDRKPTDVRYNPWEPVAVAAPAPPPAPRPPLALAGLLGGAAWTALVEGIPGREGGVLLRVGDSVNGVKLVALRGDTAWLSGFDTTWALTPRRAWR